MAPLGPDPLDSALAAPVPASTSPLDVIQAISFAAATDMNQGLLSEKPLLDLEDQKATNIELTADPSSGAPSLPQSAAAVGAMIQQQREQSWEFASAALSKRGANDTAIMVFNLFALEAYHIAERLGIPCAAASPYLIPYASPTGFERTFRRRWPTLYTALQVNSGGEGEGSIFLRRIG